MVWFGLRKAGPPQGQERVLAYLLDVQRQGAPLKVEDARGCEVPACLDLLTPRRIVLGTPVPPELGPGAETHLVFILDGLRFKAPTRVLEADSPGTLTLDFPWTVELAERRKVARGYLSAREGAAAMAMAGLFNPMASTTTAALGPAPLLAGAGPSMGETAREALLTPRGERPWAPPKVALASTFRTAYLADWMRARQLSLGAPSTLTVVEQSLYQASFEATAHPNRPSPVHFVNPHPFRKRPEPSLLACGLTYTFLSRPLPEPWRRAFQMTSVKLEAYYAGHTMHLGIRVK